MSRDAAHAVTIGTAGTSIRCFLPGSMTWAYAARRIEATTPISEAAASAITAAP